MVRMVNFRDNLIRCTISGNGRAIVFLHGYLESLEIWEDFKDELLKHYKVICVDLPGHGKSAVYADNHSMEFMADAVKTVLDQLKIRECFLVGHSMGGYVTLAFLEMYPHLLSGFSLMHSSPFADNEEKKENRNKAIKQVESGNAATLCQEHVPKTFADKNVDQFKDEIQKGIEIAKATPDKGIIAALNGMKSRMDLSLLLKNTRKPFLFIHGLHDHFIPADMPSKIEMPAKSKVLILKESGHMGFIEQQEDTLQGIMNFMNEFIIE